MGEGHGPGIDVLGDHRYLVRAWQDDEVVEVLLVATPDVVARIAGEATAESAVVDASVAWLLERQRVDELPAEVDLDDVAAAYADFETDLRRRLGENPTNPTNPQA